MNDGPPDDAPPASPARPRQPAQPQPIPRAAVQRDALTPRARVEDFCETFARIRGELGKVIVGQTAVLEEILIALFAGAALPGTARIAVAQAYPARPVRIIVGVAAGGANDTVARLLAQWLSGRLGQPFVVENRPGAGGSVSAEAAASAPPDGYTLLFVTSANAIDASLYDKPSFNFLRDIAPVASLVRGPLVMEVNPLFPARTVPEFIAYAKAHPDELNMASAGIGNTTHVVGALFMDPNTTINASNRGYLDRANIGKIQATYRLPMGVELASTAVYLDGLVFARQLLVTGLAQGPIAIAATVRGSPEGGNRAESVINWNLRAQRRFFSSLGQVVVGADILNVINAGARIQESDLSGPNFLERLPVAIQEPRSMRILLRIEF